MRLVIFEDEGYGRLYPLTYLRATFELRCGMLATADRIRSCFPHLEAAYAARADLKEVLPQRFPGAVVNHVETLADDVLLVNGRVLDRRVAGAAKQSGRVWVRDGTVLAANVPAAEAGRFRRESVAAFVADAAAALPRVDVDWRMVTWPWDLVNANPHLLAEDFDAARRSGIDGTLHSASVILGDAKDVYVAPGAEVLPFVCLDARSGPITIDEGAVVNPHSYVQGPCYIGRGTHIVGAKVREGCSIGPVCRIGGEVEESIIHGYSNKYHDGFLGHAYVGEWVNLGALTTNSDIKNDYSPVQVYAEGDFRDTGSIKVGCFIGDHTKTSIGTFFNTGTSVGIMTLLVGSGGLLPKFIPSFVWFAGGAITRGFGLDSLLDTARAAMARRKKVLTPEEEDLIRTVHALTDEERRAAVKKDRRKLLGR